MSRSSTPLVLAAAAGAALATYFLDPQQGRRRRALVRDKVGGKLGHVDEAGRVVALDLKNRALGTFAALRQRVRREAVPDEVLSERVRARLGRIVSHPGAIEVSAHGGTVTLRGPVLKRESRRALRVARAVPGVRDVADCLEPHEQADGISALQGGRRRDQRIDVLQEHWSPATRMLVGGAGGALVLRGLALGSAAAPLLLVAGGGMVARAATNMSLRRLLGAQGRAGIELAKTMHVAAPLEKTYAFWSDFESFPRFLRNVREVRRNRDDSWHWEVAGPLGARVQWDAVVTARTPNQVIAWATVPGAPVQHAGMVRFQPEGEGTRIQVQMSYNPPAGVAGHVVARLFGADPKAEMDEDLLRMKTALETGKPARDAARA